MIEASMQIHAVRRDVAGTTLEAGEAHVMTISQTYDAAVADVWDACTNPERIARWFTPVSGELRAGGHYQIEGNASGKIERCDAPNGFAATWEYGGSVSWIEVRLAPAGDGRTRFELQHTVLDDEKWAEFGPGAVGIGWDLALRSLASRFTAPGELGEAGSGEAGPAWMGSEEGRAFLTLSNQRWHEAYVAAGVSEGEAGAAARRCLAAYTGMTPDDGPDDK